MCQEKCGRHPDPWSLKRKSQRCTARWKIWKEPLKVLRILFNGRGPNSVFSLRDNKANSTDVRKEARCRHRKCFSCSSLRENCNKSKPFSAQKGTAIPLYSRENFSCNWAPWTVPILRFPFLIGIMSNAVSFIWGLLRLLFLPRWWWYWPPSPKVLVNF